MKKAVNFFLVLCLTLGLFTPIYATEITNSIGSVKEDIDADDITGEDTTQGKQSEYKEAENETESTNVYLTKVSTYTVTIPKTVILDGETDSGTYAVKVEGNLAGKEVISVIPDTTFSMEQEGKDDISASVEQDKTEWRFDEVDTVATGTIQAIDATAGSWNGSFNFAVSLDIHTHNYTDGRCECGDLDPEHTHTYENFKCICGETDPEHTHEYTNNSKCVCGDLDPEHVHEYTEGTCTCGATETPAE